MIFFDLDDTLLDHSGAQQRAALDWRVTLAADVLAQNQSNFPGIWQSAALRHWKRFERGEISFAEQRRRRVREVLGQPELSDAKADEYFALYLPLYEAQWRLFPDVIPALELLHGQRLGVLTNGDADQQQRKLERLGLNEYFAVRMSLDANGPRKPSPQAFALAEKVANVSAVECLYIGDHIENDALAARSVGWRGVWLDRTGIMRAPNGIERITSLLDVPLLLK